MHAKCVWSAHCPVHHECQRNCGLFTRLENHRTDGCVRWSAALHKLDIRWRCESKRSVTGVGHGKRNVCIVTQSHLTDVNNLAIHFQSGRIFDFDGHPGRCTVRIAEPCENCQTGGNDEGRGG
jgi:hypothetical protein